MSATISRLSQLPMVDEAMEAEGKHPTCRFPKLVKYLAIYPQKNVDLTSHPKCFFKIADENYYKHL